MQPADVTRATVVLGRRPSSVERMAAKMLVEEAGKRGAQWIVARSFPAKGAVILLGTRDRLAAGARVSQVMPPRKAEGYILSVSRGTGGARVLAIGNDTRGCMFAAGHILRALRWGRGRVTLPIMSVRSAPAKPMRGHQLGWRPTANSYDRWGLREYEQYIRDLIVWGTNAIELIPFDDAYDREKNTRMTCALADLIASYGLDVWLWYPVADGVPPGVTGPGLIPGQLPCPSQSAGRKYLLDRRRELFARMKHLDGVLIPGGDPAGCNCEKCTPWVNTILPLAEEIAGILHRYHPKAGLWLSNQGFLDEHNDRFYAYLREKQPSWLAGVVHGPWAEQTIESMRKRTPARYPVRQYPDICHCVRCQYPVPDWDQAFAATLGREPAIYRPTEHAHIARIYQPQTCGAITYSDGVTDDLNKVIWSAMLWDPRQSDEQVLNEYAGYFFGQPAAAQAVKGMRGLEANWRGPLAANRSVAPTYALWRRLEARHPQLARSNWRFQMALLRACYDRYVQLRLGNDMRQEAAVRRLLASGHDPIATARTALDMLGKTGRTSEELTLRTKLLRLGQQLFDSIGLQLSVSRWGASGSERGAVLDFLDVPLANQEWIKAQLTGALASRSAETARKAIRTILSWEDPGPGGFYDDLGNPARQPHLVRVKPWKSDPGYVLSTRTDFAIPQPGYRQSWVHYAESLYGAPIIMRYTGLDPSASYRVRATYSGRYRPTMTLKADDRFEVHGPVATRVPAVTLEWPVPREATADGSLTLRWDRITGRGAQVSEVWLIKNGPAK
jgi:hypothetical protein